MTTAVRELARQTSDPATAGTSYPADLVLTLLQAHQIERIDSTMCARAERRLEQALEAARRGRLLEPDTLLRQLVTDLGITLNLP